MEEKKMRETKTELELFDVIENNNKNKTTDFLGSSSIPSPPIHSNITFTANN